MRHLLTAVLLAVSLLAIASSPGSKSTRNKKQEAASCIFRVYLTDKQGSNFQLSRPGAFLSRRAIERRRRQQLAVDSTDLPVSAQYRKLVAREGFDVIGQSRWQNTLLVRAADSALIDRLQKLPFVSGTRMVWKEPDTVKTSSRTNYAEEFLLRDSVEGQKYGTAYEQIGCMGGDNLHSLGLRGKGMMIAVIDGGFKNADRIPCIQKIDIRGWRDFVDPDEPKLFAETDHGTKVLSVMGVNEPFYFIGTAPEASYWLLRSEDQHTEQEVEEDYWTMAAEFADSVGCDVINSSLGYSEYDHKWMSYRLWQLDGKTAFISRSAAMLAGKGMILVNSAGNSGMGPWKKIGVPADADNILAVGAINDMPTRRIAPFSSVGPSQDGRTKPDVVAIGAPARVVNGRGGITSGMGTSFAAPVVCGMVACLWQSMPQKSACEVMDMIRMNSNNFMHPDNIYGYGLPNFWLAFIKYVEAEHVSPYWEKTTFYTE